MAFPVLPVKEMERFAQELFDRPEQAQKAAGILKGILEAQSPRLSDIAQAMPGNPEANYKAIQRFLEATDPRDSLLRLFDEEAPFIIGDPTEIPRRQAKKTEYVGRLSDGKTLGFWCLVLARPYHGRALPCACVIYSEGTLAQEATSRNQEHRRAFRVVKELLGEKPLVLDREFSYEGMFRAAEEEGIKYVVRLNLGSRPTLTDAEGHKLVLLLKPGERVCYWGVHYKGKVPGNVAGEWRQGLKEPLWVFTNLEPEQALAIYQARMKLDQSFRDLKSLLGLEKIMNKKREYLEKMIALVLLAYGVGLLVGEAVRAALYRGKKAPALLRAVHPAQAPDEVGLGSLCRATPAGVGAV